MSWIDKFKFKGSDDQENIGKVMYDSAADLIKKLSGTEIKQTKKIIDNVVVVTNASGGTGASTIASNMAYMAKKKGFNVLVIDLNIMYPVQHSYFGIKQGIEKPDIVGYLLGKYTLGESIDSSKYVSLWFANNRSLMDCINCESDIAVENYKLALDKLRQLFDLIIIDTPMKIENLIINTSFYLADQIYLVWDEGISSMANTERIRRNMATSGIDSYTKMKAILNKRTNIHYSKYPFQKLNIELAQVLPFEVSIIEYGLRSVVFCDKAITSSNNANEFYKGISSLTDAVIENGGYIR